MPDKAPNSASGKGLQRRLGPLPIWGWAAAGAGAYGVWYLYSRHQANLAATGQTSGGTSPYATAGGLPIDPNTGQTYASELAAATGAAASTNPGVETLAAWEEKAAQYLASKNGGKLTGAQALAAIKEYLNGEPISAQAAQALSNFLLYNPVPGSTVATMKPVRVLKPTPGVTHHHTPSEKPGHGHGTGTVVTSHIDAGPATGIKPGAGSGHVPRRPGAKPGIKNPFINPTTGGVRGRYGPTLPKPKQTVGINPTGGNPFLGQAWARFLSWF